MADLTPFEELYPPGTDDGTVAGNGQADYQEPDGIPDDLDGAALLDELVAALTRYVVFPSVHAVYAIVLWIAATHAQPAWQHATRLVLKSPEKRCAKSKALDLIESTCHKPLVTVNASVAAIFRSIGADNPPTLIVDEADTIWNKKSADGSEDLRGLFNAGFGRGRPAIRCVGPTQIPTEFQTFCMVAMAAIGDTIPDTIIDRAVTIPMRRRAPGEQVSPYRHRRDAIPLRKIGERLGTWIRAHLDELERAEPDLPVEDRAADLWEPLCAVADLAGGAWPARASMAAIVFTNEADSAAVDDSLAQKLLSDLRDVLGDKPAVSSADLVTRLLDLPESPWTKFGFTQADLARRLKGYGVRPRHVWPDGRGNGKQVRGYQSIELNDLFERYLKPKQDDDADDDDDPSPNPSPPVNPSPAQVNAGTPETVGTPLPVPTPEPVPESTRDGDTDTAGDTPDAETVQRVIDALDAQSAFDIGAEPQRRHPAKYSPEIVTQLARIAREILPAGARILDPFAGVGGIHELQALGFHTVGTELESEWATQHRSNIHGDARRLPFPDDTFDAVITSPTYGNRMADHHNAQDGSRRISYKHTLGRDLTDGNAGAMQWGDDYRDLHEAVWLEVRRVLREGGLLLLNMKDHIRQGEVQAVTDWHIDTLEALGFETIERSEVGTRNLKLGVNADLRLPEQIVTLRAPALVLESELY